MGFLMEQDEIGRKMFENPVPFILMGQDNLAHACWVSIRKNLAAKTPTTKNLTHLNDP
jgi:hypothetical protein